jgi:ligand-binding sensor protein
MNYYRLPDLLDMRIVQKLADANFLASRVPVSIIDACNAKVLVQTGGQDICEKFHRTNPLSSKYCHESDKYMRSNLSEGRSYQFRCKNGLWYIALPIMVAGRHLATLFLKQFFHEDELPKREFFIRQAHRFGFDLLSYLEALDGMPVFNDERFNLILSYEKALVRFISDLAEQALIKIDAEWALLGAKGVRCFPESVG